MGPPRTCGYGLHVITPCCVCPRTYSLYLQDTGFQLWAPAAGLTPSPGHTPSACPGEQLVPGRTLGQTNSQ